MDGLERLIAFGRACGAADCQSQVAVTLSEREEVDHVEDRWAIAPGHALQAGDRVLERHERYWVVTSAAARRDTI